MPKNLRIQGSNSDDIIDARGISAVLQGGKGNDIYYVDDLGDSVQEKNGGGIDTIVSLIDWILDRHSENLILDGADDLSGTGNSEANELTGNSGNNILWGLDGADTLAGGEGDDELFGGDGDDLVNGGIGFDTLEGGNGVDTAVYSGALEDYTFAWSENDLLVTDGEGVTDTLRDIETLLFADGSVDTADIGQPSTDPVAMQDTTAGDEDNAITIDVLQNDFGQGISVLAAGNGLQGQVIINDDRTLTYIPDPDANGQDTFSYTIVDAEGRTSTAEVIVDVMAVNDTPDAADDNYAVMSDAEIAENVLSNDTDADGDNLSVVAFDATSAMGGTVSMNADGSFRYVPPANANGTDNFTYTVDDGQGLQSTATVSIEVTAANAAPVATDDAYSATAGEAFLGASVLANDSDADGHSLTIAAYDATTELGGTIAMQPDGTFTYTPADGNPGTDTFTYTIDDGNGGQSTATATIELLAPPPPQNTAPTAVADSYDLTVDTTLTGNVASNDTDPDGDILTITAFDAVTTAGGSVVMQSDGSFTYTPPQGYSGGDSFGYTIGDGNGNQATADVALNVAPATPPEEIPYYIQELIADNDWERLNFPDENGTAVVVTYAFLEEVPAYYYYSQDAIAETFQTFDDQQRDAAREILAQIESYANITFVEVASADDATLAFGMQDLGGDNKGSAWLPQGNTTGTFYADVWLDTQFVGAPFDPNSEALQVLMHEIGHAVGLVHPSLSAEESNMQYTLMETADHVDAYLFDEDFTGYQLYDIAAFQHIYGTNANYRSGDDTYTFDEFDSRVSTIWDGGGNDTLDMSGATYGVTLDLNEGAFSTVAPQGEDNLAIAFGAEIENATGGVHADILIGNDLDNILIGGEGDDQLSGGAGNDAFRFGVNAGTDTISDFSRGQDTLDFSGQQLTFADLTIQSDDQSTYVHYDGGTVILDGVETVEEEDFLF